MSKEDKRQTSKLAATVGYLIIQNTGVQVIDPGPYADNNPPIIGPSNTRRWSSDGTELPKLVDPWDAYSEETKRLEEERKAG
ncbi:hypothetical protein IPM62_01695 [Candidatus Woesebacteria bacterium]|nr:MAG: hypothetical protein IPM62_01695 [Candidatus Woesebacteria bacterium]